MTTTEETTALILSGSGYDIQIAPEAIAKRDQLVAVAENITRVTNNDESADAAFAMRQLAQLRIEVEKARKTVKEPVLQVGKRIDAAAKEFLHQVEVKEEELKYMIGVHATEVARQRAEAEAAERKAAEEARRAREAAEAAREAAEQSHRIADVITAKKAEAERQQTMVANMAAAEETAATRVAEGVRFAWDFEVVNIHALAAHHPDLVRMEPKRAEILAEVKAAAETGASMDPARWSSIGLRPFKKPVVSTR
jgi:hypothetical protein